MSTTMAAAIDGAAALERDLVRAKASLNGASANAPASVKTHEATKLNRSRTLTLTVTH